MLHRDKLILKKFTNDLASEKNIVKIIAFGSRIRGDFHEDSDLDLLIILTNKNRRLKNKIYDKAYNYELKNDIPFSVIILSKYEYDFNEKMGSPFIKNIMKEGVVLYGNKRSRKNSTFKIQA